MKVLLTTRNKTARTKASVPVRLMDKRAQEYIRAALVASHRISWHSVSERLATINRKVMAGEVMTIDFNLKHDMCTLVVAPAEE